MGSSDNICKYGEISNFIDKNYQCDIPIPEEIIKEYVTLYALNIHQESNIIQAFFRSHSSSYNWEL